MRNVYLGVALICFVCAIVGASHQMHYGAFFSAVAAAFNFVLYKIDF